MKQRSVLRRHSGFEAIDYVESTVLRQLNHNLNQLHQHEVMQLAKTLEPEKAEALINKIAYECAGLERKRMNAEHETHKLMTVLEMTKDENVELKDTAYLERQSTGYLRWGFFFSFFANLCFIYLIFFA